MLDIKGWVENGGTGGWKIKLLQDKVDMQYRKILELEGMLGMLLDELGYKFKLYNGDQKRLLTREQCRKEKV